MQSHGPIRSMRVTLTIKCVQMENIKHINESHAVEVLLYDIHQDNKLSLCVAESLLRLPKK